MWGLIRVTSKHFQFILKCLKSSTTSPKTHIFNWRFQSRESPKYCETFVLLVFLVRSGRYSFDPVCVYLLASYLIQADWKNTKKKRFPKCYWSLKIMLSSGFSVVLNWQYLQISWWIWIPSAKPATSPRNFLTEENLKKGVAFMSWQFFSLVYCLEFPIRMTPGCGDGIFPFCTVCCIYATGAV